MVSRGGFGASRGRRPRTGAAVDAFGALARDNPDKALVMAHMARLVADGFAVWERHDNGEVVVRFTSGEAYLLADTMILRLA